VRVLLDECIDWRLSRDIVGHEVRTARQMGWTTVDNGALLALASASFDVFVTVDRNLSFQQNLAAFPISVIVLRSPQQPIGGSSSAGWKAPYGDRCGRAQHRAVCRLKE